MKVAFYKAFCLGGTWDEALADIAIGVSSFGKYSHVEFIFSDGMSFSISGREGIGRFKEIDYNLDHWKIIDIKCTEEQEKTMRDLCILCEGAEYDWIGAFFSITPICIQRPNKYFCSEIVTNILNYAGVVTLGDGCKYSPSRLERELSYKMLYYV